MVHLPAQLLLQIAFSPVLTRRDHMIVEHCRLEAGVTRVKAWPHVTRGVLSPTSRLVYPGMKTHHEKRTRWLGQFEKERMRSTSSSLRPEVPRELLGEFYVP